MSNYCPNKNTKEFKRMSSVLGDKIATAVWYENQGNPIWLNRQGKPSELWNELQSYPGVTNEDVVMKIKSRMYTKSFKARQESLGLDQSSEPSASVLVEHVNTYQDRMVRIALLKKYKLVNKEGGPKKWVNSTENYKKLLTKAAKLNQTGEVVATITKIPTPTKTYLTLMLEPSTAFTTEDGVQVAFYDKESGEITFTDKGLTAETVVHEFAHPFIDALANQNKELFDNLIVSINQDYNVEEIKRVIDHVNTHYKDASQEIKDKELLAYTLSEYGKGNINPETGKNTKSAIRRFYAWVKDLATDLRDLLRSNGQVHVDQISPNTKYTELADFFTVFAERGVINLAPSKPITKTTPEDVKEDIVTEKDAINSLRDELLGLRNQKNKGNDGTGPAHKMLDSTPVEFINLADEALYMSSLLPKEISTTLAPGYIKVLSGGRRVVGMFEDSMIVLSEKGPKGTAFHEGFHAVFRTLLDTKQQKALIKEVAREEANPTAKEIFDLQLDYNISEEEAMSLFREEQMADAFSEFMENPQKYSYPSGIKGFFQQLLDWFKYVFSSKTTIRKLFRDVSTGKYTKKTPNLVKGIAYKVHPTLSISEVNQITRELTSIAFEDIKSIEDLQTKNIRLDEVTRKFKEQIANSNVEITDDFLIRLRNILDTNNNISTFWLKEMDSYMRHNLGLKAIKDRNETINEEDQDEENLEDLERNQYIKASYEVSGKVKTTAAVKFLIAMTPEVVRNENNELVKVTSNLTGLPVLVDFATTYNDVENLLADIVSVQKDGIPTDTLQVMLDKLEEHSNYKPHLAVLSETVRNANPSVQTQFFNAFSRQKGNFVTHTVKGQPGSGLTDGIISTFGDANFSTKATVIRNNWAASFEKEFGKISEGQLVYDDEKITTFATMRDRLLTSVSQEVYAVENEEGKLSITSIDKFYKLLQFMGVNVSPETVHYIVEQNLDEESSQPIRIQYALEFENILYEFKAATDALLLRTGSIFGKNNHIMDESTFFKNVLGEAEAYFKKVPGENAFVGPDGNQIYSFQDNDLTSKVISQIKQGDLTHLENVTKSAYGKNSLWAEELLKNQSLREVFHTEMYGNLRSIETAGDRGAKASELKPVDAYMDNVNKHLSGYYIGLAEADKSRQTYFKGPRMRKAGLVLRDDEAGTARPTFINNEGIKVLKGYLADELSRMRVAHAVVQGTESAKPAPEKDWVLYYHYYSVAPGTGTIGKDLDKIPGNAFQSFLFPTIDLDSLGLKGPDGNILPLSPENFDKNEDIDSLIKNSFYDLVKQELRYATEIGLIEREDNGNFKNRLIAANIVNDPKRGYKQGNNIDILQMMGDYVLNSIIGSVEQTKLFNGDPAFYKVKGIGKKAWKDLDHFGDFKKRIPAVYAAGKDFRIFSDNNGTPIVRAYYTSATIANIETPSAFFGTTNEEGKVEFNKENMKEISKVTGVSVATLEKLFKPYLEINQTDAQAWITLEAYRERMNGLGKWTDKHEDAYNKANSEALLDATEVKLLAQPLKTVHAELKPTANGEMMMHYNKQSEAVLLPFMKDLEIGKMLTAMEKQGVDHVIVLDGKKVGASGIVDIMEGGKIKDKIEFNPVDLSYNNLFLQQDLPTKGIKDTLFGSQGTKNVLSVLSIEGAYDDMSGREVLNKFHEIIGRLSDKGLISLDKELGYNKETDDYILDSDGRSAIHKKVQKEFETEASENHLNALEENIAFDALPIKNKIMNKLLSLITKRTVKLEQSGGALIQLSDLGMIASETELTDKVKNGIIWFKDPKASLQPMHIKEGEIKPAQILIPHTKLLGMLSKDTRVLEMLNDKFGTNNFKELTSKQIESVLDKEILEGLSYRIPNQAAASNDAFEIVGVLPEEMGDTMIAFSDITTKTGSDFDIDKAYVVLPNFYYDQDSKKIKKIEYKLEELSKVRIQGLQNARLDLMRMMLMHPEAYTAVMAPLDDPWLENYAKDLFPENTRLSPMQFFTGSYQLGIKQVFDNAKSLVGVIANHMTHHSLIMNEDVYYHSNYIGKGNYKEVVGITEEGTNPGTYLSQRFDEKGKTISNTLGAFMNAIVDAAKDPFISRANINQYTAGTAFMLARAGVDRKWIVSFIGQPIIRDVVAAQASQEGRFGQKEWDIKEQRYLTAIESVLRKYKVETNENNFKTLDKFESLRKNKFQTVDVTTEQLEKTIKYTGDIDTKYEQFQLKVLKQFLEYQGMSKGLNDAIKVAKVDVEGAGKTLISSHLSLNLAQKVLRSSSLRGLEDAYGVDIDTTTGEITARIGDKGKMIGRYFANSLQASMTRLNRFFIAGSKASLTTIENVLGGAGYTELITNENVEQVAIAVSNEIYTYAATNTNAFTKTPEELIKMFYGEGQIKFGSGKASLADRLTGLKHTELQDNLLIQSLSIRPGRDGAPDKIYLPNTETVKETQDALFQAWDEILSHKSEDIRQLGEDLAVYAFYTSGFSKSVGGFFEHIPNEWLKAQNFHEDIQRKNTEMEDQSALIDAEAKIYKNLYKNNQLVPVISEKSERGFKVNGQMVERQDGFMINSKDSLNYAIGEGPAGTVFKRFIKRKVATAFDIDKVTPTAWDYLLYELAGYNTDGHPVYLRTNKLGVSGYGNNIKEYFGDGKTSIFPQNNVSLPEYLQPVVDALEEKGSLTSEEYKKVTTPEYTDSKAEDRLAFCIMI